VPRTGESIYKRKDGRWEGRYKVVTDDGKSKYRSVYGSSHHDAKEKLLQAIIRTRTGTEKPNIPVTVEQVALAWLEYESLKTRRATYGKYKSNIQLYILPLLGEHEIGSLELIQIQNYVSHLLKNGRKDHKGGLSEKTVKDILVLLKDIFKYAEQCDIKVGCRIDSISVHCQTKDIKVLSPEEEEILSNYLLQGEDSCKMGIYLTLQTGIRIGELSALRWSDIDLQQKILHVRRSLSRIREADSLGKKTQLLEGPPKTQSSVRDIPLTNEMTKLLEEHFMMVVKTEPIASRAYLMTGKKEPMESRTIQNHFKACLRDCGIADINYHALRHTFASKCAQAGFDAKTLSEILGHSTVSITLNRYVHSSLQQKRINMEKISRKKVNM
jgi:integrase